MVRLLIRVVRRLQGPFLPFAVKISFKYLFQSNYLSSAYSFLPLLRLLLLLALVLDNVRLTFALAYIVLGLVFGFLLFLLLRFSCRGRFRRFGFRLLSLRRRLGGCGLT